MGEFSATNGQDLVTDLRSTLSDVSVWLCEDVRAFFDGEVIDVSVGVAAVTVSMNIPPSFLTWELPCTDTVRIDE